MVAIDDSIVDYKKEGHDAEAKREHQEGINRLEKRPQKNTLRGREKIEEKQKEQTSIEHEGLRYLDTQGTVKRSRKNNLLTIDFTQDLQRDGCVFEFKVPVKTRVVAE